VNYRELEESLTRLESVDAVRVVHDGNRISEVHVIAALDRAPKQVVRDVQSLAMARFGENIDRRVISVVQISPNDLGPAIVPRPVLIDLGEEGNGTRTTLKVTLRYQDREHTGTATGPAVSSARLRLIGEATIDAVERTFDKIPPIALDSIAVSAVGSHRVVVAVVVAAAERGSEELAVGSALSDEDDGDAAVKAVLNALNRRLALITE
jgi:hypothetical protein